MQEVSLASYVFLIIFCKYVSQPRNCQAYLSLHTALSVIDLFLFYPNMLRLEFGLLLNQHRPVRVYNRLLLVDAVNGLLNHQLLLVV